MQRSHSFRHLAWRSGGAAVSHAMMFTGFYPLVLFVLCKLGGGGGSVRSALAEWGMAAFLSAARPHGNLTHASGKGPRPIIVLHGYAMNRANFTVLAYRLRKAGLGPIYGFEYWTLGRVAAGARQLGWFVDEVREATGADKVDLIGHSMGGVVARYYAALAGGHTGVDHLITIGSPHAGTDVGRFGIGHPARELVLGSKLIQWMQAAPVATKLTTILSEGDALVPASQQPELPGAERIVYADLGHVAMLGSKRVANAIIERLRTTSPS